MVTMITGMMENVAHTGWNDRDRLLGYVDSGENAGSFCDAGKSFVDDFRGQVGQLKVNVVFVRSAASALLNFHVHTS